MIKNIFSGISAYAGSFGLISQLKLWKYFIIPIVISVVTATIIGFTAYGLSDNIGAFLAKIWVWDWGKETFTTITSVIGGLFVLVIGFLLYKHIVMALSAPFMSPVSEKIEIHINGNLKHNHRRTSFQEQLIRGIRISLRNIGKELLLTIPLLLLSFIPIIGIFFTALLFLLQAYYVGFGNMDYTLERHFNYKDSINFVGKKRGFAIGNGIVFMMCMLIPVIGIIIVLPLSVTAASVKTVALLNTENNK
ncbi:EI24 domain-containing protein [Polaribacter sp. R2A056_3_33]|uniref:EI24 domain-containing protein n=1 Tax=unclassified Polaribacter TaxID=196858 RepID=UPI001C4F4334|nr:MULTISPECIES: EI24 domain-containing protein [unclassified Polaribacter]QXP64914.1 EI24 domain-containing protein [Polaribacter sp. HaHaR_3_91]QXP69562.1 EI24 domain-containing protein [Polaribacter sp. R2A056_3_33]